MDALARLRDKAKGSGRRLALAEGEDARIAAAAVEIARLDIAEPVLLGRESVVRAHLQGAAVTVLDPSDPKLTADYVADYRAVRSRENPDAAAAQAALANPLNFAAMMVRRGAADGAIAGAVATSAETARAALRLLGPAPGVEAVSSFFMMVLNKARHGVDRALIFADCGLIVKPTPAELAGIALASADSFRALVGETPRVAMLSFSSRGSARHPALAPVTEALALARAAAPDLLIDGELQFDAAFAPDVAAAKAPDSPLAGAANIFIFPDLQAGNIGYKIAQRIGGADAIGPVFQGLAHPYNDLSRGCTAADVVNLAAITALQAAPD